MNHPSRKNIRLNKYNYAAPATFFITICTNGRTPLFGKIQNSHTALSPEGHIIAREWVQTAVLRPYLTLGTWVVMPDHFHAIVHLQHDDEETGTARRAPTEAFGKPIPQSLPTIVRAFKSATSRQINLLQKTPGHRIWQRGYHERIIRNDNEYAHYSQYINDNPKNWNAQKHQH